MNKIREAMRNIKESFDFVKSLVEMFEFVKVRIGNHPYVFTGLVFVLGIITGLVIGYEYG
jgi:hypothetical protein